MNMRDLLEKSLYLCEKLSLEDLHKYPEASYLIPLLHDALEQEEKCNHTFDGNICRGCGYTTKF